MKQKIFSFTLPLFVLVHTNFLFAQVHDRRTDSMQHLINQLKAGNEIKKASLLLDLGDAYITRSDYPAATDCFQQSLMLSQEIKNDTLIAQCYEKLSILAFHQQDYYNDSAYAAKALILYKKLNKDLEIGKCMKNIGASYLQRGNAIQAEKYLDTALVIFKRLNEQQMLASVYADLGVLSKNQRKSIELYLAAKKIWDKYPSGNTLDIINTGNLGVAYFYIVRFDSLRHMQHDSLIPPGAHDNLKIAEQYIHLAIRMAKDRNDMEDFAYFTEILSELQYHNHDYKGAYDNFLTYQTINDSIFSQENKNKIASLESRREIEKKNREIEKQKLQVREQKKNTFILFGSLLLMSAIGFLFYRISVIRKQKNKQLVELNKELDDANKLKAKFFGILSHDLRSPVANLLNFLNLRKIDPEALSREQVEERENKIGASAQTLLETMESMLLWSKSQMQQFRAEKKSVKIGDLFLYVQRMFAADKNIRFHFPEVGEMSVETDEHFLKTIMYNLTANAVNALSDKSSGEIKWEAWQENKKLFLSISDNGPGIDEEKLKALYDETAISGSVKGFGLHIIRDLAKAIGCSIALKPQASSGAAFILCL